MIRNIFKTIGAIVAGFVATFALSYGTDAVLGLMGVLPAGPLPMYGSELLIITILVYRNIFNVVGCYLAARLAPNHPMGHALGLGGLGFVLSIVCAIVGRDLGPAWYLWGLVVLALPSAWLGGKLFEMRGGGRS